MLGRTADSTVMWRGAEDVPADSQCLLQSTLASADSYLLCVGSLPVRCDASKQPRPL